MTTNINKFIFYNVYQDEYIYVFSHNILVGFGLMLVRCFHHRNHAIDINKPTMSQILDFESEILSVYQCLSSKMHTWIHRISGVYITQTIAVLT